MNISPEPVSDGFSRPASRQPHARLRPNAFLRSRSQATPTLAKWPARLPIANRLLAAYGPRLHQLVPESAWESVTLRENTTLYQAGDAVEYIYFPETVVLSEFELSADGATLELAMTGSEGAVGLLPAWNNSPTHYWTQVLLAGIATRMRSEILRQAVVHAGVESALFFAHFNGYVRQIAQRAVCNNRHALRERFCTWLLLLQARHASPRLPLSQEQIARSLGVHRPSITGIAQSLRDARVIDYRRGAIVIANRQKLEQSACQCFAEINR